MKHEMRSSPKNLAHVAFKKWAGCAGGLNTWQLAGKIKFKLVGMTQHGFG
jgi:hypothetical protein